LGTDITGVFTWYLEKIIRWGWAATGEQEIAAKMQRDFLREHPDGVSGGQPDLSSSALAFPEPAMQAEAPATAKLRL